MLIHSAPCSVCGKTIRTTISCLFQKSHYNIFHGPNRSPFQELSAVVSSTLRPDGSREPPQRINAHTYADSRKGLVFGAQASDMARSTPRFCASFSSVRAEATLQQAEAQKTAGGALRSKTFRTMLARRSRWRRRRSASRKTCSTRRGDRGEASSFRAIETRKARERFHLVWKSFLRGDHARRRSVGGPPRPARRVARPKRRAHATAWERRPGRPQDTRGL